MSRWHGAVFRFERATTRHPRVRYFITLDGRRVVGRALCRYDAEVVAEWLNQNIDALRAEVER